MNEPQPTATDMRGLAGEANVQDTLPERQGDRRDTFFAEWGVRKDDGALIVHIFPPVNEKGEFLDWPDDSTMGDQLKAAIDKTFDTDRVTAGYQPEQSSFYIIAGGYGEVLDVRLLVQKFLERIEAAA